jgi:hypothetical protein
MKANVTRSTVAAAYIIAMCADAIEIGLAPLFSEGFMSPLDDILDTVVCVVLTMLLGWHIAFIPSYVIKLLPIADFAPTWTIAVLIATRAGRVVDVPSPIKENRDPNVVDVHAEIKPEPPGSGGKV